MLFSLRDPVWYAQVPSRKKKTNLTSKWILLQWNYDQYCLRPKECKTSSQKSSLLGLALCNIWQQRYDCKGVSLWCLSFARLTELRFSGRKALPAVFQGISSSPSAALLRCFSVFLALSIPFEVRYRSTSAGDYPNFSKYHLSWEVSEAHAAWLLGGRKWCFWETIPSAPHPRISGRPVS